MEKKIIISLVVLFIVFALGTLYTYLKPLKTISKNGVSFSYPKTLSLENDSVAGFSYDHYFITNPLLGVTKRSTISISIPLDGTAKTRSLAEEVKSILELKDFSLKKDITNINIDGHNGEMIVYTAFNAESIPPFTITYIIKQLKSKYSFVPIELKYVKLDSDSSLDQAWEVIQKTLKF